MHEKTNLGFVLKCCGRKAENCAIYPTSSNGNYLAMKRKIISLRYAFAFSIVLQMSFVCLGTIMMLQKLLPEVTKGSRHTLSKAFSTFWAITTAASMFWAVLFTVDMYSFAITVYYHPQMSGAALGMGIISIIIEIPIALYYGRKHTITVPCIYLAPARLACCGNRRLAAWLVRTLFLLMSLSAVQIVCIHATYFILALGAAPFVITTNIVLAVFCFFCMVHILAILFTLPNLGPQLGTCKKEKCQTVLHGVSLVVLLIAMFLFTLVVASSGYIINIGTDQGSLLFALNKVVLPLGMCLTGVILKRLSTMWWQAILTEENEEEADQLSIGYNFI